MFVIPEGRDTLVVCLGIAWSTLAKFLLNLCGQKIEYDVHRLSSPLSGLALIGDTMLGKSLPAAFPPTEGVGVRYALGFHLSSVNRPGEWFF